MTGQLLAVLADLVQTVDRDPDAGALGGVLLHTSRGHFGDEPGQVDLLAGASTDRRVAGHTYTWCTGQLPAPSLWSLRDVRSVLAVFKAARGRDKDDVHAVEIHASAGQVEIREDPNLIDEGVSLRFAEGTLSEFPARVIYRILHETPPSTMLRDGVFVDAEPRTDLTHAALAPFLKVAKRRGELLQLYRNHQHAPVLVQIGDDYRGVLIPVRPTDPLGDTQNPDADLHAPDLQHSRWDRVPADQPPTVDQPTGLFRVDDAADRPS